MKISRVSAATGGREIVIDNLSQGDAERLRDELITTGSSMVDIHAEDGDIDAEQDKRLAKRLPEPRRVTAHVPVYVPNLHCVNPFSPFFVERIEVRKIRDLLDLRGLHFAGGS